MRKITKILPIITGSQQIIPKMKESRDSSMYMLFRKVKVKILREAAKKKENKVASEKYEYLCECEDAESRGLPLNTICIFKLYFD